ncbi:hypothetical protein HG530_007973 [Fusarium avenaceum]|nr:hypothetical protein HG530_007973 [Fusarium avenaceum]
MIPTIRQEIHIKDVAQQAMRRRPNLSTPKTARTTTIICSDVVMALIEKGSARPACWKNPHSSDGAATVDTLEDGQPAFVSLLGRHSLLVFDVQSEEFVVAIDIKVLDSAVEKPDALLGPLLLSDSNTPGGRFRKQDIDDCHDSDMSPLGIYSLEAAYASTSKHLGTKPDWPESVHGNLTTEPCNYKGDSDLAEDLAHVLAGTPGSDDIGRKELLTLFVDCCSKLLDKAFVGNNACLHTKFALVKYHKNGVGMTHTQFGNRRLQH